MSHLNYRQQGFTMIELMISMLLGLSLIAGVSAIFVNSQTVYKTQRSLGYMMEDGRYVLETLSKELRRTGFLRSPAFGTGQARYVFRLDTGSTTAGVSGVLGSGISMALGEYVHGKTTWASGDNISDAFVIRYQLNDQNDSASSNLAQNNTASACSQFLGLRRSGTALEAGEDPATNTHVVSLYFDVVPDADNNNAPTLSCRGKRETINPDAATLISCQAPGTPGATSATCLMPSRMPLISNVERMIVRYGVDRDNDKAADYYIDAVTLGAMAAPAAPSTGTWWERVVAMKVFIVLRSEDDNISRKTGTFSIEGTLCNGSASLACPAPNKRMYRVFTTTIALRNQLGSGGFR